MKKEVLSLRHNIARNQRHYSRNKCLLSSSTIRLFFFQLLFSDTYVPVKWKLQHPLPWKLPGHLNFWKCLFKSSLPEPKSCSNAPTPWENYQITVELFSSFYCVSEAVYVNMVNYRQHPYKHIKSNIVDGLTITSWVAAKIIFMTWIYCRFYTVSCNNT